VAIVWDESAVRSDSPASTPLKRSMPLFILIIPTLFFLIENFSLSFRLVLSARAPRRALYVGRATLRRIVLWWSLLGCETDEFYLRPVFFNFFPFRLSLGLAIIDRFPQQPFDVNQSRVISSSLTRALTAQGRSSLSALFSEEPRRSHTWDYEIPWPDELCVRTKPLSRCVCGSRSALPSQVLGTMSIPFSNGA